MPEISGWWVAVVALFPMIAGLKSYLLTAWSYILGRIRIQIVLEGSLAQAMLIYLKDDFEPIFTGQFKYIGVHVHIRSLFRNQLVPFAELPESARIFRRGWQLIRVSIEGVSKEEDDKKNRRSQSSDSERPC